MGPASAAPLAAALLVAGCVEESAGRGFRDVNGDDDAEDGSEAAVSGDGLTCTEKPTARTYHLFDGSELGAKRKDENVGVNRARIKPYVAMAGEFERVLGAVPPNLAAAGPSFEDPPPRWYAEAVHSGVSLNAYFDIAFQGCSTYVKGQSSLAKAPTAETAKTFCSTFIRKAWSRTASPEEVDECVTLATDKLAKLSDTQKRWAHVCASVLSSSQFLTY